MRVGGTLRTRTEGQRLVATTALPVRKDGSMVLEPPSPPPTTPEQPRWAGALAWVLGGLALAMLGLLAVVNVWRPDWAITPGLAPLYLPGPDGLVYALVVVGLAAAVAALLRWRRASLSLTILLIAPLALAAGLLGLTGFWRCAGTPLAPFTALLHTLSLFAGEWDPDLVGPSAIGECQGAVPLGMALARVLALTAVSVGAVAATMLLFRRQVASFRVRRARDVDVVVGLEAITLPLIRELVRERRDEQESLGNHPWSRNRRWWRRRFEPPAVVVLHLGEKDPLVAEATALGAVVIDADTTNTLTLRRLLLAPRTREIALRRFFAVSSHQKRNLDAVARVEEVLRGSRTPQQPRRNLRQRLAPVPRITARLDDPREAHDWRLAHVGQSERWFLDAFGIADLLARHLAEDLRPRREIDHLVIAGDTALTIALLDEIGWLHWSSQRLECDWRTALGYRPWSLTRITLVGPDAERTHQDWAAYRPPGAAELTVESRVGTWEAAADDVLSERGSASRCAVAVTGPDDGSLLPASVRLARLHGVLVYAPDARADGVAPIDGGTIDRSPGAVVHYGDTLLAPEVEGTSVPEDSWTELARLQHNHYLNGSPPDGRAARGAWPSASTLDLPLPEFYRRDNLRQIRNVLATAEKVTQGRWLWRPARADERFTPWPDWLLYAVAEREHAHWLELRERLGWSFPPDSEVQVDDQKGAGRENSDVRRAQLDEEASLNGSMREWASGAPRRRLGTGSYAAGQADARESQELRRWNTDRLHELVERLFHWGIALRPTAPEGPAVVPVRRYRRIGTVHAERLTKDWTWSSSLNTTLESKEGDWRVTGPSGEPRGVSKADFQRTHEPMDGRSRDDDGEWQRCGVVLARRAGAVVLPDEVEEWVRSREGWQWAGPGTWIVTDDGDPTNSWVVTEDVLATTYERLDDGTPDGDDPLGGKA